MTGSASKSKIVNRKPVLSIVEQIENHNPPIIGAICAFDAKIYKNVGGIFAVSACGEWNKRIFNLFYFCLALPSLLVDFLETSVYGQPFTCGKGSAAIGADGTLNVDAYYSNGEHDIFDANYILGPANKFQIASSTGVYEGIVSQDLGIIFLPEYIVPSNPTQNDWIGGIFLVRSAYNTSGIK